MVPDNIVLLPPPFFSPELKPVENIWECLRGNFLSHRVWDIYEVKPPITKAGGSSSANSCPAGEQETHREP
jgi:hypothetical protein